MPSPHPWGSGPTAPSLLREGQPSPPETRGEEDGDRSASGSVGEILLSIVVGPCIRLKGSYTYIGAIFANLYRVYVAMLGTRGATHSGCSQ